MDAVEGLTSEEYKGLRALGYSKDDILKMSPDEAKAAYWNKIEKSVEKDGELMLELESVLGAAQRGDKGREKKGRKHKPRVGDERKQSPRNKTSQLKT